MYIGGVDRESDWNAQIWRQSPSIADLNSGVQYEPVASRFEENVWRTRLSASPWHIGNCSPILMFTSPKQCSKFWRSFRYFVIFIFWLVLRFLASLELCTIFHIIRWTTLKFSYILVWIPVSYALNVIVWFHSLSCYISCGKKLVADSGI